MFGWSGLFLLPLAYLDCGFNTPNVYAARTAETRLLANPAVFPDPASLANCEFMRDVGPVIALHDQYWTEIKAR